jgi:dienelactone hydrolase
VIHENRGLNPHIEDSTHRLALENFVAFAPDGFNNHTTPRYDAAAAKLAWERTLAFFEKHLRDNPAA